MLKLEPRELPRLVANEAFFMAMYDSPDEVHRLMARLRDNALQIMRWAEAAKAAKKAQA